MPWSVAIPSRTHLLFSSIICLLYFNCVAVLLSCGRLPSVSLPRCAIGYTAF